MKAYQHMKARNDINGNPQRLFAVYEITPVGAAVVGVIDEGYAGTPKILANMPEFENSIEIPVKQYHNMLKHYPEYKEGM